MDDLISRQAAIDEVQRHKENVLGGYEYDEGVAFVYAAAHNHIIEVIKCIPSAQKKGHWNFVGDNLFKCTCCGKMYTTQQLNGLRVYDKDPYCPFFCPNCGADMRGEDDG